MDGVYVNELEKYFNNDKKTVKIYILLNKRNVNVKWASVNKIIVSVFKKIFYVQKNVHAKIVKIMNQKIKIL